MDKAVFIARLCKTREQCTEPSAKTHFLTMKRVYRIVKGFERLKPVTSLPKTGAWLKPSFFKKIDNLSLIAQRNLITSAVVYLQLVKAPKTKLKAFTDHMYQLVKQLRKNKKETRFELNDKQKKMWMGKQKLQEAFQSAYDRAKTLIRKRTLSQTEKRAVRDAILLSVYTGHGVPVPRLDWSTATWTKDESPASEGTTSVYKKRGTWFVAYGGKTKRVFGVSTFPIKNPLLFLIKRWYSKYGSEGERLFQTNRGQNFTPTTFGRHLQKVLRTVFERPVTASFMRHLFVSHRYEGLPKILKEFERDAKELTHSSSVQLDSYLKKPN